jgi:hypothetical protein
MKKPQIEVVALSALSLALAIALVMSLRQASIAATTHQTVQPTIVSETPAPEPAEIDLLNPYTFLGEWEPQEFVAIEERDGFVEMHPWERLIIDKYKNSIVRDGEIRPYGGNDGNLLVMPTKAAYYPSMSRYANSESSPYGIEGVITELCFASYQTGIEMIGFIIDEDTIMCNIFGGWYLLRRVA